MALAVLIVSLALFALVVHAIGWAARFMVGLFLDHPIVVLRGEVEPGSCLQETCDREPDTRFLSRDGVELRGWLIRSRVPTRRVIVFFHEYGASGDSWARYLSAMPGAGFHVFTFDFRGSGESETPEGHRAHKWATGGEVCDAGAALDLVRERALEEGWEVLAFGASRGAAAMMMAAATRPWLRILACEGMSSTLGSIRQYIRRWANIWVPGHVLALLPGALWRAVAHAVVIAAERREGTRFPPLEDSLATLESRRTLFIYGERDSLIDASQRAGILSSFAGDRELWLLPATGHLAGPARFGDAYGGRLILWYSGEPARPQRKAAVSEARAPILERV